MAFDSGKLRLEQFSVELNYHATFNYWSLKGVLAERWAHGPILSAYSDEEERVVLLPEKDERIRAIYGLKASALRTGYGVSEGDAVALGEEFLGDAYDVLSPRQTVGISVQHFSLHAIGKPLGPSAKLRDAFYQVDRLAELKPSRYSEWNSAIEGMFFTDSEDRLLSYRIGAIGPPHGGKFFLWSDEERDSSWWMGVNTTLFFQNEAGIDEPLTALSETVQEASDYHEDVVMRTLPSIV